MKLPSAGSGIDVAAPKRLYMGVDPGTQGAIAVVDENGRPVVRMRLSKSTETDIKLFMFEWAPQLTAATIERVSAMPKQGVSSTFKFGRAYGFLRAALVFSGVPFEDVTPAKWQGALGCRSKGDKNVTKAKAQELLPDTLSKIVHEDADGWLIALYCARKATGTL